MTILSSALTVMAVAAAPLVERGALPLALHTFKLPLLLAFPLVVVGNSLPAIAIIYWLDPVMLWLAKHIPFMRKLVDIALVHFRKKVHPWVDRYGTPGLILVVGIPTPLTGSWTGAGGAAILGMHKRNSLFGVIVGATIANLIILLLDLGIIRLFT